MYDWLWGVRAALYRPLCSIAADRMLQEWWSLQIDRIIVRSLMLSSVARDRFRWHACNIK